MATRSTDVQQLSECPGKWVLNHFHEADKAEASFFQLGTQLHETIECAIVFDLDLDAALQHLSAGMDQKLELMKGKHIIESSKRGVDTMHDDGARMLTNWYKFVHPDSEKRHEIYDDYGWPPRTEVPWKVREDTAYGAWGSVDAVFRRKVGVHVGLVDWKSGTTRQKNYNQLHFYTYGLNHRTPVAAAWFHNLDRTQKRAMIQEAEPYPGDDVVRQRILATEAIKDSILDNKRVSFNPDWYCGYCPVQEFCPEGGDPRREAENRENLRRMLQLARPLTEIERIA